MLRIRLRRMGKKKQPFYRLVVADSRAPRDGAFIETIGQYNPLTNPAMIEINEERAREWIGKGAIPSDRAVKLLASKGIVEAPTYDDKPKKGPKKAPPPAAAAATPAAAAKPEAPAEEPAAAAEEAPAAEPAAADA